MFEDSDLSQNSVSVWLRLYFRRQRCTREDRLTPDLANNASVKCCSIKLRKCGFRISPLGSLFARHSGGSPDQEIIGICREVIGLCEG